MPVLPLFDLNLYYEVHGAGRPLVLIHGGMADSRMWEPQIGIFAERYRVITYDLRGHGRTGGSPRRAYTPRLFVDDLQALLSHLGLQRAALCGLSLGGMVAQAYAATHPTVPSALVLCDTAVSTTLTLGDKAQTYLVGWSLAPTVRLLGARRFVDLAFRSAQMAHGDRWFGEDAAVREYVRQTMLAMDTTELAKIYELILRFKPAELAKIGAPTLILNGEHESRSVLRHAEYMCQHIPNARLDTIPAAGHVSNMENPGDFNEKVLSFLQDITEQARGV